MRTGPVRPALSLTTGVVLVVVGAVGLLDAVIGDAWDLAVLFGAVVLIGAVGVVVASGRRRSVTLRADLASFLAERARRTGEPFDAVLDRSVATYIEALDDSESSWR